MKVKIKEIIVVEGKADTQAVKKAVIADTIETNGSEVSAATIAKIKLAKERRGVIILTDPDYQGERIRKIISDAVPGCGHAFITKVAAKAKGRGNLGVENADIQAICEALKDARKETAVWREQITMEQLYAAGLINDSKAKKRRQRLGEILQIGYTNGKQLYKRLHIFKISAAEFEQALKLVLEEESNEQRHCNSETDAGNFKKI